MISYRFVFFSSYIRQYRDFVFIKKFRLHTGNFDKGIFILCTHGKHVIKQYICIYIYIYHLEFLVSIRSFKSEFKKKKNPQIHTNDGKCQLKQF